MSLIEVFLVGVGLSMDAFAVSVGKGLAMGRAVWREALKLALAFGAFQALMPVLGWLLASGFAQVMASVDHWVAFILLSVVGGKMLYDAFRGEDGEGAGAWKPVSIAELLMLAVATSIDAFAVGITFVALDTPLFPAVAIIGLTTFAISYAGVWVGGKFGERYSTAAEALGGCILIAIGLKVLVEHLVSGM